MDILLNCKLILISYSRIELQAYQINVTCLTIYQRSKLSSLSKLEFILQASKDQTIQVERDLAGYKKSTWSCDYP